MLKEVLPSSRKSIILNGNLHKRMNRTRNKYTGKYNFFSYFKNPFQREFTFKTKVVTMNEV